MFVIFGAMMGKYIKERKGKMSIKTIVGITCACVALMSFNASAISIDFTEFLDGSPTPVDGTLTDSGGFGSISGSFFGYTWVTTGEAYFDFGTTDATWEGETVMNGVVTNYLYDVNLTETQVAWGGYWSWSSTYGVPKLIVMDCVNSMPGSSCTGYELVYYGPFVATGPHAGYIGVVSAVPVPAAAWLFGSGIIGLIGIARRKVHV